MIHHNFDYRITNVSHLSTNGKLYIFDIDNLLYFLYNDGRK